MTVHMIVTLHHQREITETTGNLNPGPDTIGIIEIIAIKIMVAPNIRMIRHQDGN